jgi:opacity protein-like surface antigen
MAKIAASTVVLTLAVLLIPTRLFAQARQPYSIQGSALYTVQDLGTSGSVGGAGAEVQFRYNPSRFSIGLGLQYSHHQSGDEELNLAGVFLEPRMAIDAGSDRVTPYLAGRIALLRQSSDFSTVPAFSSYGSAFGVGGGLLVHLNPRVNFDVGGAYLRQSLGDKSFPDGSSVDFGSINGYVVKAGFTFGLGHR